MPDGQEFSCGRIALPDISNGLTTSVQRSLPPTARERESITNSEIIIRPATPQDVVALRSFVPDVFTRKDILSVHLNISEDAYITHFDQATRHLDFNTSTVATTASGDIVACFLSAPYNAPFDITKVHTDVLPALMTVKSLGAWFEEELKHIPREQVLHCFSGATKDGFEGKGINKELRRESLERAHEAGWQMVVVECVTPVTQHLMRDVYGFTVGKEIQLQAVEYDGRKPFAGLSGSAMLLYKRLVST